MQGDELQKQKRRRSVCWRGGAGGRGDPFWVEAAQPRKSGVQGTEALAAFLTQSSKLAVSLSVCAGSLVGCTRGGKMEMSVLKRGGGGGGHVSNFHLAHPPPGKLQPVLGAAMRRRLPSCRRGIMLPKMISICAYDCVCFAHTLLWIST